MSPFELEALKQHPDEGPVTMLNLMKFREDSLDGNGSGRDAYGRYAAVSMRLIGDRGCGVASSRATSRNSMRKAGVVETREPRSR